MGGEGRARARSAAHQVTLAFLLPLGLGLIHAAVGLSAVNQVITVTGNLDSSSGSLSAAALLLDLLQGKEVPHRQVLPAAVIVREST